MSRQALVAILAVTMFAVGATFLLWGSNKEESMGEEEGPRTVVTVPTSTPSVPEVPWVRASTTSQGIDFEYPEPFSGAYVRAQTWPPLVELVANDYACFFGPVTAADGPLKTSEQLVIGGKNCCRVMSSEGAAGSLYMNYEYSTDQGDFVARLVFTLRTVQCGNYDEPAHGVTSSGCLSGETVLEEPCSLFWTRMQPEDALAYVARSDDVIGQS